MLTFWNVQSVETVIFMMKTLFLHSFTPALQNFCSLLLSHFGCFSCQFNSLHVVEKTNLKVLGWKLLSWYLVHIDFVSTSSKSKELNGLLPTLNFPTSRFFYSTFQLHINLTHLVRLFAFFSLSTGKVLLELSIYVIDLLGLYWPT